MQFETMIGLILKVRSEIQRSLFHLNLTMLLKSRNLQQLFIIEIEKGFLARFQHLLYVTCLLWVPNKKSNCSTMINDLSKLFHC